MNIIKNLAVAALLTTSLSCAMAAGLADTDFAVVQNVGAKTVKVEMPGSALLAATDISGIHDAANVRAIEIGRAVLAKLETTNKTLFDGIVLEIGKDATKKFDVSAFFQADKDLGERIQTNDKRLEKLAAQADAFKGLFGLESVYDRMVRLDRVKEINDLRALHPHRSSPLAFDPSTGSRLRNDKKTFGAAYDHGTEGFSSESDFDNEIARLKLAQKGTVDSSDHAALSTELKAQLKATRLAAHAEIDRLNKAPKGMDAVAAQGLVKAAKFSASEVEKGLGKAPVSAEDWLNGALVFASKAVDAKDDLEVELADALDKLSKAPTAGPSVVKIVQTPGTYSQSQVDAMFAKHMAASSSADGLPLLSSGGLDHAALASLFTAPIPTGGSADDVSHDRAASPVVVSKMNEGDARAAFKAGRITKQQLKDMGY